MLLPVPFDVRRKCARIGERALRIDLETVADERGLN
jgi:hypothetical protein